MIKTFDGTVDGKHVERWEMTEEEKETMRLRKEKNGKEMATKFKHRPNK